VLHIVYHRTPKEVIHRVSPLRGLPEELIGRPIGGDEQKPIERMLQVNKAAVIEAAGFIIPQPAFQNSQRNQTR